MKNIKIDFYIKIPILTTFAQVFDKSNYKEPPTDWHIVVTDVINSTKAIEAGKYKDVNVAGALPAMAITNYIGHMQFPFIFGGDGMLYIIPSEYVERTKDILADTRDVVHNVFDLELRVGIVSMAKINKDGYSIGIARLRVSDRYVQAIIDGNGVEYAESLIKDPGAGAYHQIPRKHRIRHRADFSGFTCRWRPISSTKGEMISMIVKPQVAGASTNSDLMRSVFTNIGNIFGSSESYRPITSSNQRLGLSRTHLNAEASVLARRNRGVIYGLRLYFIRLQSFLMMLMRFRLHSIVMSNSVSSDFRKFDGTLKMIISCSTEQRQQLDSFLNSLYVAGKIYYGIHISDRALLTCLVQQGEDEVHFVDSDDGGYAIAAKYLKRQVAYMSQR